MPNILNIEAERLGVRRAREIRKKINYDFANPYVNLTDDEIMAYFQLGLNDYICAPRKFVYPDVQSPCQYIKADLVLEAFKILLKRHGKIKTAQIWEDFRVYYKHLEPLENNLVYCTDEGQNFVKRVNKYGWSDQNAKYNLRSLT